MRPHGLIIRVSVSEKCTSVPPSHICFQFQRVEDVDDSDVKNLKIHQASWSKWIKKKYYLLDQIHHPHIFLKVSFFKSVFFMICCIIWSSSISLYSQGNVKARTPPFKPFLRLFFSSSWLSYRLHYQGFNANNRRSVLAQNPDDTVNVLRWHLISYL